MSQPPAANDHPPAALPSDQSPNPQQPEAASNPPEPTPTSPPNRPPRPKKKKGPNYALLHSSPLPLSTHPLPPFHPSHPLSLLHLCYTYLSHLLSPPSSHPTTLYTGYFSPQTRSVHITDPRTMRALWEMGFFGKGTLSRSEPSWLERESAKVLAERAGEGVGRGGAAEEATRRRREERRLFKLERARVERGRIERQRAVEEGRITVEEAARLGAGDEGKVGGDGEVGGGGREEEQPLLGTGAPAASLTDGGGQLLDPASAQAEPSLAPGNTIAPTSTGPTEPSVNENPTHPPNPAEQHPELNIPNQEHLQLTLEEAFFLSFALGVLEIRPYPSTTTSTTATPDPNLTPTTLLGLFTAHSTFPPTLTPTPTPPIATLPPDSPFLLAYTTYHHFRSLGWVIRPGVKFAVDYLLYNRGPVFSHAEFGVLVLPAYTHPYWSSAAGLEHRRKGNGGRREGKDWWWLHCVNRVQSQVRKTLVLAFVDVPPPYCEVAAGEGEGGQGIAGLLRRYEIREFVVKRWLANRSRD
ncbi:hypothetical protein LTR08_007131 [Meristemomyces frigidus]|nr:hypothetical protein LTR08_007131 [Meristemomyces frigidus]